MVQKSSAWVPVSDEDIIDFGLGTREQQAAAAARLDREEARQARYWSSLPFHVRLLRTLDYHRSRQRERFLAWLHRRLYPECNR